MASVIYDWYWMTSVLGETATLNLCPLVSCLRNCCFIICLVVQRLIYTAPATEGRAKLVNNPAKGDDNISPARSPLCIGGISNSLVRLLLAMCPIPELGTPPTKTHFHPVLIIIVLR